MIPKETVDRIIDAARIEEVVGDFVTLKRAGSSLKACCPFHSEKTPSFVVTPSKGIYKCFGCGKAGSAVSFVMEYEHMTYVEALRYLAKKYNIPVQEEEETPEQLAARQKSESLYIVSEFAHKFFINALKEGEGRAVGYAYFKSRGLEDETIEKYGLGWAPRGKSNLRDAAVAAGYKTEYLVETGLCAQFEDGTVNDRFYNRVVFPIHSVTGRVIAFGARTLLKEKSETVAKYVNSKESEIYVKNKSLYGLWFAKQEISRKDKCFLVEGYLDVLSMHQLGIKNVVASSGTSLTDGQISLIHRFTENVTVMYDGDNAGVHASLRAIGMLLKAGMNVKLLFIPDGDDPDSYARKHTLEEVETFIAENEQDFIDFMTDQLLKESQDDPIRRAELINEIADTIAGIPDAIKRTVYIETTAHKLNMDQNIIADRVNTTLRRLIEDERKAQERQRRESGFKPAPGAVGSNAVPGYQAVASGNATAPAPAPAPSVLKDPMQQYETNTLVGPSERELVSFLLTDGTEMMPFEKLTKKLTGDEQSMTVAEYIDAAFSEDNTTFINECYRKVYDKYMEGYFDKGYEQDAILKSLLNCEDDIVRTVTANLSVSKYKITVDKFEKSMMAKGSWLVNSVPKSIMAYNEKRLEFKLKEVKEKLNSDPEHLMENLVTLKKLQEKWLAVRVKLGRERED
ncbi:MAG: DNA primase [Bacteroidales bacterium]|nr:DNA primase [Bacteroidales bacterium]